MTCCSETRGARLTVSQRDLDDGVMLQVEYAGGRPVRVVGPVTGREYDFSGLARVQAVDPRDGVAILADRFFRLTTVTAPTRRNTTE
jgi:hypothetical protein